MCQFKLNTPEFMNADLNFQGMRIPSYDDELLLLAEDLGRRMLPAFDTPTGTI